MIDLACKACGSVLQVADSFAGKRGKCQKCKAVLEVPAITPTTHGAAPASSLPTQQENDPIASIAPAAERNIATAKPLVFSVLKWIGLGIGGIWLVAVFADSESAPREAVYAGLACFFGIVARLMQAEQHFTQRDQAISRSKEEDHL
jgi:phage FluMu protein Com